MIKKCFYKKVSEISNFDNSPVLFSYAFRSFGILGFSRFSGRRFTTAGNTNISKNLFDFRLKSPQKKIKKKVNK
jgi:hypothetical protein